MHVTPYGGTSSHSVVYIYVHIVFRVPVPSQCSCFSSLLIMGSKYRLLEDLPRDLWLYFTDFLRPADVENILNTGSHLWNHIFKSTSWLEFALEFDRCPPLLGYEISNFRANSSNKFYVALIAHDYSGDLRYHKQELFAAFHDGYSYDEDKHEAHFPSGLTVNIEEVIIGHDSSTSPLEMIFTHKKGGVYSAYCHYKDRCIKILEPSNILGSKNANDQYDQPAYKGRVIKHGSMVRLVDGKRTENWHIQ